VGAALLSVITYGYLAKPGWVGVADKTLWDWMQLLIVPLLLAGGGYLLNSSAQQIREQISQEHQLYREEMIMMQRTQDEVLRAYLAQMNRFVIDGRLIDAPEDTEVRRLAQASTLQTVSALEPNRKRHVLRLIYDLGLISKDNPIISLETAELEDADLGEITLHDANLRGAHLDGANLERADLKGSDLREVDLSVTRLRDADLSDACLTGANLTGADLTGTAVTEEQLAACKSLKGATMPNGQKYENWLKSKGRGEEEGENSGP
jgi:hypothetical protein